MQNREMELLLTFLKYLDELSWSYDIWFYREMTYVSGNQQGIFGFSLRHRYGIEATVFRICDFRILCGCIGYVQATCCQTCQNSFS